MKEKPLFIADGHHRYETSLVYKEQMRKENGTLKDDMPFDYVMMVCVSMSNPGLKILPAHRLLRNIDERCFERIIPTLKESFHVEPLDKGCKVEDFMSRLNGEISGNAFVMYVGKTDAYYKLRLINPKALDAVFANTHPEWKSLDAGILHGLIINKFLGITSNDVTLKKLREIREGRNGGRFTGTFGRVPIGLLSQTHPYRASEGNRRGAQGNATQVNVLIPS